MSFLITLQGRQSQSVQPCRLAEDIPGRRSAVKIMWRALLRSLFLAAVAVSAALFLTAEQAWQKEPSSPDFEIAVSAGKKLCAGSSASFRVIVRNSSDGSALAGIPVKITLMDGKEEKAQFKGVTDSRGTISPLLTVPPREGKITLEITAGEGPKSVSQSHELTVVRREALLLDGTLLQSASERTFVARARLLSKPFLAAVAGERIVVELADSKGSVLSRREADTDSRGFAVAEFQLPPQRSQAIYELRASCDHARKTRRFAVPGALNEEVQLTISFEKSTLLPGDAILGTVQAALPDGRPVVDASIELTIKARDREEKTLAELERQTDDKGLYRFKSQVPSFFDEKKRSSTAYLIFHARVTKGKRAGECTRALPVLASSPYLNLLPERIPLKRGMPTSLTVISVDGEGAPFPLNVRLSGGGLNENLDPSVRGWASAEISPEEGGTERITVSAAGPKGADMEESFSLPVERSTSSLLMRPDRHFHRRGEPLRLEISSTEKSGAVYLDFMAGGEIIKTESMDLSDGRASFTAADRERFAGPVTIRGYVLKGGSRIDDELSVLFDPDASFRITSSSLKSRYTPGEIMPLELSVAPEKGADSPSEAAVELMLTREGTGRPQARQWRNGLLSSSLEGLAVFGDGKMEALLGLLMSPEGRLDTLKEKLAALLCAGIRSGPGDLVSTLPPPRADSPGLSSVEIPEGMFTPRLDGALMRLWKQAFSGDRARQIPEGAVDVVPLPSDELILRKDIAFARARGDRADSCPEDALSCLSGLSLPQAPPSLERAVEAYYYEPLVISGKDGVVRRDIPLPPHNFDGGLMARALTGSGELSHRVTIFQSLLCEVPLIFTALTTGDRISLPVRVVNYSGEKRSLSVEISKRPWFELKSDRKLQAAIGPYEDGFLFFNMDVLATGTQKMTVGASMGGSIEEVRGEYAVLPRAARDSRSFQGVGRADFTEKVAYPQESLQEGRALSLVLYSGALSPMTRALQALTQQRPVTSQALMTKLLLEMELESQKKSGNAARSEYQDSLPADVSVLTGDFGRSGGISSVKGGAPSTKDTACAFRTLGKVRACCAVDEESRARMLKWLLSKRSPRGMWIADDASGSSLYTSACIVEALLDGGLTAKDLESSVASIREAAKDSKDPLTLALLVEIEKRSGADRGSTDALISRLLGLMQSKGSMRFWKAPGSEASPALDCEATAMAVCAIGAEKLKSDRDGIARFILSCQEANGTWSPLQVSYPASKALYLLYSSEGSPGEASLAVNGARTHTFKGGGSDISTARKIDLSEYLSGGDNTLKFSLSGGAPLMYQLIEEYYVPTRIKRAPPNEVSVTRLFSAARVKRGENMSCEVKWSAAGAGPAQRVTAVVFPVPWGFKVDREALGTLRAGGALVDYELTRQELKAFVRSPSSVGSLNISMTALFPCKVAARPAIVYDYDCPQRRGSDFITDLEVSQ